MKDLDIDLKCMKCRKIFESMPITLVPCGWVVCGHHIESNEMKCFICPTKHNLIRSNCVSTKSIEIKFLQYKLENSLKEFNQINTENNIETTESSSNLFHLKNLLNKHRDQAKVQIDQYFDKIMSQIKEDFELNPIVLRFDLHNDQVSLIESSKKHPEQEENITNSKLEIEKGIKTESVNEQILNMIISDETESIPVDENNNKTSKTSDFSHNQNNNINNNSSLNPPAETLNESVFDTSLFNESNNLVIDETYQSVNIEVCNEILDKLAEEIYDGLLGEEIEKFDFKEIFKNLVDDFSEQEKIK